MGGASESFCVLIDVDNVQGNAGRGETLGKWLALLRARGKITICEAFGEWTQHHRRLAEQLDGWGVQRISVSSNRRGKNAADITIAVHAMRYAMDQRTPVDTFVIMSGDSDFVPLIAALRSAGYNVIGCGPRGNTPADVVVHYDEFLFSEDLGRGTPRLVSIAAPMERDPDRLRAWLSDHGLKLQPPHVRVAVLTAAVDATRLLTIQDDGAPRVRSMRRRVLEACASRHRINADDVDSALRAITGSGAITRMDGGTLVSLTGRARVRVADGDDDQLTRKVDRWLVRLLRRDAGGDPQVVSAMVHPKVRRRRKKADPDPRQTVFALDAPR